MYFVLLAALVFCVPMEHTDTTSLLPIIVTLFLSLATRNVAAGAFMRANGIHNAGRDEKFGVSSQLVWTR